MKRRYEIKLAGIGGQGILFAGIVLAEAIVRDGKNVLQTQSHGAETRGGPSLSEIIIADGDIAYPRVLRPDLLLAMSRDACSKHIHELAEDGIVIVDSSVNLSGKTERSYSLPIISLARSAAGNVASATIVALGAIAGLTTIVSREAILKAIEANAPGGTEERNCAAVFMGYETGEALGRHSFFDRSNPSVCNNTVGPPWLRKP